MTNENASDLLFRLFQEAVIIVDRGERARFVDSMERRHPDLGSQLSDMVETHFLLVAKDQKSADESHSPTYPDFGQRFKPVRILGEGGFGIVYLAMQTQPLKRKVAIKVLKSVEKQGEAAGRFRLEQNALAMLDHPGFAKVLETGETGTGQPFYVMEYIDGCPIIELCDQFRLPISKRLLIFADVCNIIQYAHQQGIIHRDLKPSNILVTVQNGLYVPKIIDLGIAKSFHPDHDHVNNTKKFQLIGSPQYMAPEQAGLFHSSVDGRADVYSLGIVLYQILAGTPPYDEGEFKGKDLIGLVDFLENHDLPAMSSRFQNLAPTIRHKISQNRSTSESHLRSILEGDLRLIVEKSTQKSSPARYQSVNEVHTDIDNYLNQKPLIARPPSKSYLIGKFVARHKLAVGLGLTIVLTLLVALVVSIHSLNLIAYAERLAQDRLLNTLRAESNSRQYLQQLERANVDNLKLLYVSDISDAANFVQQGDYVSAKLILDRYGNSTPNPELAKLRGVEWHFLMNRIFLEHDTLQEQGAQFSVARFLPDSPWLVTGDFLGRIHLINAETRKVEKVLIGHSGPLNWVDISPDGRFLASAADDGLAIIWSLKDGQPVKKIVTGENHVHRAIFLDDPYTLVTSADSNRVQLWNWPSGKLVSLSKGIRSDVKGRISFLAKSNKLLICYNTYDLAVMDPEKLDSKPAVFGWGTNSACRCLSISPDEKLVALGLLNNEIRIVDLATREVIAVLANGHRDDIQHIHFHPNGTILASCDKSGQIRVWNASDRNPRFDPYVFNWPRCFYGHTRRIWQIGFSPSGNQLVSAGKDGRVCLWEPVTVTSLTTSTRAFNIHPRWIDRDRLLVSSRNRLILWNTANNKKQPIFEFPSYINCVSKMKDTRKIAVGLENGTVNIIDLSERRILKSLSDQSGDFCKDFLVTGDGEQLYSIQGFKRMVIWDPVNGKKIDEHPFPRRVYSLGNALLWRELLICYQDDVLRWSTASQKVVGKLDGHTNTVVMAKQLGQYKAVSVSDDRTIRVWDLRTNDQLFSVPAHDYKVSAFDVSPDQRTCISGDEGGRIAFTSLQTGKRFFQIDLTVYWGNQRLDSASEYIITDVQLSPDGNRVAVAVANRGVLVFELNSLPAENTDRLVKEGP